MDHFTLISGHFCSDCMLVTTTNRDLAEIVESCICRNCKLLFEWIKHGLIPSSSPLFFSWYLIFCLFCMTKPDVPNTQYLTQNGIRYKLQASPALFYLFPLRTPSLPALAFHPWHHINDLWTMSPMVCSLIHSSSIIIWLAVVRQTAYSEICYWMVSYNISSLVCQSFPLWDRQRFLPQLTLHAVLCGLMAAVIKATELNIFKDSAIFLSSMCGELIDDQVCMLQCKWVTSMKTFLQSCLTFKYHKSSLLLD